MLAYRNYAFILESFISLVRNHDRDMVILFSLSFICSDCFQLEMKCVGNS